MLRLKFLDLALRQTHDNVSLESLDTGVRVECMSRAAITDMSLQDQLQVRLPTLIVGHYCPCHPATLSACFRSLAFRPFPYHPYWSNVVVLRKSSCVKMKNTSKAVLLAPATVTGHSLERRRETARSVLSLGFRSSLAVHDEMKMIRRREKPSRLTLFTVTEQDSVTDG